MEIVICKDAREVGMVAADRLITHLEGLPTPVIGFATGGSPKALYAELARRAEEGSFDFSHALGFALDEYVGIPLEHPESYYSVIRENVVGPLKMDPARVRVPDGLADDLQGAADEYDEAIDLAGGVDVQILGIGSNGHIGFNEPFSSFSSRTRVKTLTPQTREDNARFFDSIDQVPTHCVTQGLGTIMDAAVTLMVASGENKAQAIADMVEGPVAATCPASVLQFHPRAIVVIDEAAAANLKHSDYFRHLQEVNGVFQRD
ncbi:glucosamine-6-phosphate deaminase [Tessaracoccus sp. HDW20]|uniref:glucosamine-6-phosphate deaminase n=1 Tax=Tessaracoccus coleopterorum TaxID=2714950 RepID=UPI0018D396E0|nr:glucosamine-6-phosphate deaminase [Tessaracoccus coleopterorum]NHB84470.1 glucosamine-6-phosphate deaminase [Tessaracoccus coleopterorum]